MILATVLLAVVVLVGGTFIATRVMQKPYHIVYIGHGRPYEEFDALLDRKMIAAIREELSRLSTWRRVFVLECRNIRHDPARGKAIYDSLDVGDPKDVVAIVDNTMGSELQASAATIKKLKIPVIATNADRQGTDYGGNVLFLGHNDHDAAALTSLVEHAFAGKSIVLVTEAEYGRKAFEDALRNQGLTPSALVTLESDGSRVTNLSVVNRALAMLASRQPEDRVFLVNAHSAYAKPVIRSIYSLFRNSHLVLPTYAVGVGSAEVDNRNGNSIIVRTVSGLGSSDYVYRNVLYQEARNHLFKEHKDRNFQWVRRAADVGALLRQACEVDSLREPSRDAIRRVLRDLAGEAEVDAMGGVLRANRDLLATQDPVYELTSKRGTELFEWQGDGDSWARRVFCGVEILGISNLDVQRKTVDVDLIYWLRGDSAHVRGIIGRLFVNQEAPPFESIISEQSDEQEQYVQVRLRGTYGVELSFQRFPFDSHQLTLAITLNGAGEGSRGAIAFDFGGFREVARRSELRLPGWRVGEPRATSEVRSTPRSRQQRALVPPADPYDRQVVLRIPIRRELLGPVVTVLLPLALIVGLGLAMLFLKDLSFGHVGEAAVGVFLSLAAYGVALVQMKPSQSFTFADLMFGIGSVVIWGVVVLLVMANSRLAPQEEEAVKSAVRRWRGVLALAYVSACAVVVLFSSDPLWDRVHEAWRGFQHRNAEVHSVEFKPTRGLR